ncbi:deoxycytidylate deaminase [Pseudoalteromonas luteoviolacea]|uniref:Cytidine and deoxycytidylate deaminase zinc-binding region n=1 Tax=Pseudoalteromonas luteoviolacea (strain 2ta16) TaxID=1353533 RepID=V4HP35_PSEL2|nr:deoxycytidylate deaminase [Pseudoalteromonas luteoviolacea]ESP92570.1 Cytidine and deoxycytidylate deaminase zinc-binding region [Pseudoalteromonas luteoviolacea 2ta16]KZN40361.1 hypothetical protein N483_17565 [Pseudoalteromonas luteoviolacea NCIMB 1944]
MCSPLRELGKREREPSLTLRANFVGALGLSWRFIFEEAKNKWKYNNQIVGQGEGDCVAEIAMTDGSVVTGRYDEDKKGTHAEIMALSKIDQYDEIASITISSVPCPRCAVILERYNLSNKVIARPSDSTFGPSWHWPGTETELAFLLAGHVSDTIMKWSSLKTDVFGKFKGDSEWTKYPLKSTEFILDEVNKYDNQIK